jgi:hypothetical protein
VVHGAGDPVPLCPAGRIPKVGEGKGKTWVRHRRCHPVLHSVEKRVDHRSFSSIGIAARCGVNV